MIKLSKQKQITEDYSRNRQLIENNKRHDVTDLKEKGN